jgi:spore maturation protein CgeB
MKVLQVGDFSLDYYDQPLFESFMMADDIEVDKFKWAQFFSNYHYKNILTKIYYSLENRYKYGPLVKKLNRDLITQVKNKTYDIIFLWRAIHIYPATIREMKKYAIVIGYNNDQTFSLHHPWWLFYVLKRSIPFYDHFFVYRSSDKFSIEELGVSSTVFMPTFDKSRIHPIENVKKIYDVAFVGHYENDGRDELLLELIRQGFNVRLNGQRWEKSRYYDQLVLYFGMIEPVYDSYNDALNSAKVCLSFLSKLNNDTYTRRTLEIPATKTVMLAEYTDDQANMFEPDVEAVYFSDHQEAISKLKMLISDPELRESIANSGYSKVCTGPYQLCHRVNDIVKITKEKMAIKNDK